MINSENLEHDQINDVLRVDNDLKEILINLNEFIIKEQIRQLKSKFSVLLNKEIIIKNNSFWWDKYVKNIFEDMIEKYLTDFQDIDSCVQVIRFISKKFQNVSGKIILDQCFKVLNYLKQKLKNSENYEKQKTIICEDLLRECYNFEFAKLDIKKYCKIIKFLANHSCTEKKYDKSTNLLVGFLEIVNDFKLENFQANIYQPFKEMILNFAYPHILSQINQEKNNYYGLIIFKKFEKIINFSENKNWLRRGCIGNIIRILLIFNFIFYFQKIFLTLDLNLKFFFIYFLFF